MLQTLHDLDYANLFGENYDASHEQIQMVRRRIESRAGKPFATQEDCAQFAKDCHIGMVAYSASGKNYYTDSEGRVYLPHVFRRIVQNYLYTISDKKEATPIVWQPDETRTWEHFALSERASDGLQPLYRRDYFTEFGSYDELTRTFNRVQPYPQFAKNTGEDIWYVYELLKHISGDCYPWVMRWLREKMLHPTRRTEVVPIFICQGQGTGKSSFVNSICKALFGAHNVAVPPQFNSNDKFNSEYADKLILCIEEKMQNDPHNALSAIKAIVTGEDMRKERKGIDASFQRNDLDLVITSNDIIPLKFDTEDQRRFMVMEGDETFKRSTSDLADEVFLKLYGVDKSRRVVGTAFRDNKAAVQQFMYDLYHEKDCAGVILTEFPQTDAAKRCFSVPRTTDAVQIQQILEAVLPFVKQSFLEGHMVYKLTDEYGETIYLDNYVADVNGVIPIFQQGTRNSTIKKIALNMQAVFVDPNGKPIPHSVVDKGLISLRAWLRDNYDLKLLDSRDPPGGGFANVKNKTRYSPTAYLVPVPKEVADNVKLDEAIRHAQSKVEVGASLTDTQEKDRIGRRVRYSLRGPDEQGAYETLNELKPGMEALRCTANVAHMDTFLLEADEVSYVRKRQENALARKNNFGRMDAEVFYADRLKIQDAVATKLFNDGIACRVVYSGGKSLHILVRVDDPPDTLKEREWLDGYLKATLSTQDLIFDPTTRDPARLTRAPYTMIREEHFTGHDLEPDRRINDTTIDVTLVGKQRLLAQNWNNVYHCKWREAYEVWLHDEEIHPMESVLGKHLIPGQKKYLDAAYDLALGYFFQTGYAHNRWEGRRQEFFFPAYRVLREFGYTHDQIFEEVEKQLEKYKRSDAEKRYWIERQYSRIIKQIDNDVASNEQFVT